MKKILFVLLLFTTVYGYSQLSVNSAAGLGDFIWYVHNITSSQLEISVHNNAATGLISIGFDVRVCPNGY